MGFVWFWVVAFDRVWSRWVVSGCVGFAGLFRVVCGLVGLCLVVWAAFGCVWSRLLALDRVWYRWVVSGCVGFVCLWPCLVTLGLAALCLVAGVPFGCV